MSKGKARGRRHREARAKVLHGVNRCTWCGCEISDLLPRGHPQKATVDHVIPVRDGGPDVVENMVAACWRCNSRRGARDPGYLRTKVPGSDGW